MLRALFLVLLPLLATAKLTDKQRQMVEYVEQQYGSCIRYSVNCPDASFTYEKIAQYVAMYRQYYAKLLPKECECDEKSEACNRECYLAFLKKVYAESVTSRSKRDTDGLSEKQREMVEYVEKHYGACIRFGIGCPDNTFTYEAIAQAVAGYRQYYAKLLPKQCECDVTSEACNRECYLAFLKKVYAESVTSRNKRDTDGLTEKQRQMVEYVEQHYGPCIRHGTGCPDESFTYERIAQTVAGYRLYYSKILPKECLCSASSEVCNRECYLAFLKKVYAQSA